LEGGKEKGKKVSPTTPHGNHRKKERKRTSRVFKKNLPKGGAENRGRFPGSEQRSKEKEKRVKKRPSCPRSNESSARQGKWGKRKGGIGPKFLGEGGGPLAPFFYQNSRFLL